VEVDGLVNNIVGIVIDARLATEEITVKMPSPCVANWIEDKNRELTDPTDPLNFFDFPHLPYLRFFLAAAGLNTSWWPEKGSPYRFDPRYSFENFRSRCGDFKCPAALAAMSGGNPIELLFDLRYGIGVSKAETLERCNLLSATFHYQEGEGDLDLVVKNVKSAEINLVSNLYHRQWRSTVTPTARDNIRRLLVPSASGPNPPQKLPRPPATKSLSYFNQNINREQRHAVYDIVNGLHGDVPYLIWGPPGTGA
jgi:hypothetical protein